MKYELPHNHGLSDLIVSDPALVPKTDNGEPSITDIQYDALVAGIAHGKSILGVAPTSTGKTNIAIWALISWLTNTQKVSPTAVYLVSHKALARQKFDDFCSGLKGRYFNGDASAIVLATGDGIEDGTGTVAVNPLEAPLLVATYEKYLGLLSAAGMKRDMSRVLVICDEIQLLGDKTRGRSVEVLLTLLKSAPLGQMIALSAVIEESDARKLSDWLDLSLVYVSKREKHLVYEKRSPGNLIFFDTERPELGITNSQDSLGLEAAQIAVELVKDRRNLPIVVFCMKVDRVHECANQFLTLMGMVQDSDLPLFSGLSEDTESARGLSKLLAHRVGFHTADLLDEERRLVEAKLQSREIDVVFCTSTLAAGVNFPFTTAIFDEWRRWDHTQRQHVPIPASEFQNMAGRAGRMGLSAEKGRVIFCSDGTYNEERIAAIYLNPDAITPLSPQLTPETFEQVVLWLLSCGMCNDIESIKKFLLGTFSASLEEGSNLAGLSHWQHRPQEVLDKLRSWGFIL